MLAAAQKGGQGWEEPFFSTHSGSDFSVKYFSSHVDSLLGKTFPGFAITPNTHTRTHTQTHTHPEHELKSF